MFYKLMDWAIRYQETHTWMGQKGNVSIAGIILLGISFALVGLGMKFAPTMITGFSDAYTAATSADPNGTKFVMLTDAIGFGPGLVILGFIIAVAITGYLGVKLTRG